MTSTRHRKMQMKMKINCAKNAPFGQLMSHQLKDEDMESEWLLEQHATVESNPLKLEFVKSIKLQWKLQGKRKENAEKPEEGKKCIDKRQTSKYN